MVCLCSGDSDSTEHYKVEHALKLAEEKQHEADTDNAAYKANNLDLLEVSKVDIALPSYQLPCPCACINGHFAFTCDVMPQLGSSW